MTDSPLKRAFVRFQVAEPGIRRARLRVFAESVVPSGLQIHSTSPSWTETALTRANAPPPGALVDRTIRVRETGTNAAGSASATSTATARIAQAVQPPASLAPPAVTGTPLEGRTLTAVPGTWTGTPPLTLAYAWQRCGEPGCVDIPEAVGTTYVLGADDVGATIRVRETATNDVGTAHGRRDRVRRGGRLAESAS